MEVKGGEGQRYSSGNSLSRMGEGKGEGDQERQACVPTPSSRTGRRPGSASLLALPLFLLTLVSSGCNASLPEPESPAAQLYRERCAQCHRLYGPSLLTAEMWTFMISRMEQEMLRRGVPPLKVGEKQTILEYLQKHSNKPS